jgi:NAD(P)-dependent dehydrogenase (short-subunit alcohol dehydrogenase family)/3-hydroxymyristoyl/3-hydroxydecanoyl-(acyl carrier protein) dehydratase
MKEREGKPLQGKTILVTGGRRGIGGEIVKKFSEAGAGVVVNYVDPAFGKQKRNDALTKAVQEVGGELHFVQADITKPEDRANLLRETEQFSNREGAQKPGELYAAFWNAAGGLEEDKPEGWAELINNHSTIELAKSFSSLIPAEGSQIFVTSLWAHKYGRVKQLPFYRPVARTKYQAEQRLRDISSEINGKVGILCGHVITETGAYSLLKRNFPDRMALLEQYATGGKFPNATDMGRASLDMILNNFKPGDTVYVGGDKAEEIDENALIARELNRKEIKKMFPMYSEGKLLVDAFYSPEENVDTKGKELGIAEYTVKNRDTLGHFTGEYSNIKLWRGVDRIESAAQALGLTFLTLEPNSNFVPLFTGGERYDFSGVVIPGEKVSMETELTAMTPRGLRGNVLMKVGNEKVTYIEGLRLGLAPDKKTARRLIQSQITKRFGK